MAITASSVGTGDTLETFRQEFNNAVVDLGNLDSAAVANITISANNSTDETVYLTFVDGATGNQGLESDTSLTYNPSSNLFTTGSILIADAGNIGSASDTDAIAIASDGGVTLTQTLTGTAADFSGVATATTFEPDGDTASGDNAAIGYTAAEGLILTGQGSTSDVTFKNDADTTVFTIPTGTDDILFPDDAMILVGAGSDLAIYHDGSHSYIKDQGTGDLKIQGAADIVIEDTSGANAAVFNVDAGQELYWRGGTSAGKKFETTQVGGTLTGTWNVTTALVPDAQDGAALGTTSLQFSDLFLADSAVIGFGDDNDTTLTHTDGTGLTLNSTNKLTFGDAASFIQQSSDGTLRIDGEAIIDLNASTRVDVSAALTAGGIIKTDDTTEATSTTDGSLQTDGGLSVVKDAVFGDDVKLLSDASVIAFGANGDVTLTHVHDTGILLNSTMAIQFNDASQYINAPSNAILDINATDEIELNATLADVNANLDVSGTGTFGGILKTDDTTEATSTTDGSLQTDGGLSVAKDVVAGDDIKLLSDASVIAFGVNGDVTLTHVHDTGILLNSTMAIQFNDASQYINAPSNAILDINATDEIELNATLADVNANLDVSGTYTGGGLMTTGGNIVIPNAGNIGSASDTDAISISSGGVVNISATTASTNSTSGALTVGGGAGIAADLGVGDDLFMISDSASITWGADSEIALTHVHNTGLSITSTAAAPLVRRGEDVFIVLDGTNSASANAGDNVIMDASAAGTDVGDDILGEDEVFLHAGMQRNVINIIGSDGKIKNSVAGFAPGAI